MKINKVLAIALLFIGLLGCSSDPIVDTPNGGGNKNEGTGETGGNGDGQSDKTELKIEVADSLEIDFRVDATYNVPYKIVNGDEPFDIYATVTGSIKATVYKKVAREGFIVLNVTSSESTEESLIISIYDKAKNKAEAEVKLINKKKGQTDPGNGDDNSGGSGSDDGEGDIDITEGLIHFMDKEVRNILLPQIRSESVCSNQFNCYACYACVRHQIEANDALVMPL